MLVKIFCVSVVLWNVLLHSVLGHKFVNQTAEVHKFWIPDHGEDLIDYVVNKKKRSAQESRFLKFDYLSQNINVGLEFFVPAIQIPVEKSGDGIDFASMMKKVS